jgi:hypothetical protein
LPSRYAHFTPSCFDLLCLLPLHRSTNRNY